MMSSVKTPFTDLQTALFIWLHRDLRGQNYCTFLKEVENKVKRSLPEFDQFENRRKNKEAYTPRPFFFFFWKKVKTLYVTELCQELFASKTMPGKLNKCSINYHSAADRSRESKQLCFFRTLCQTNTGKGDFEALIQSGKFSGKQSENHS